MPAAAAAEPRILMRPWLTVSASAHNQASAPSWNSPSGPDREDLIGDDVQDLVGYQWCRCLQPKDDGQAGR